MLAGSPAWAYFLYAPKARLKLLCMEHGLLVGGPIHKLVERLWNHANSNQFRRQQEIGDQAAKQEPDSDQFCNVVALGVQSPTQVGVPRARPLLSSD